MKKLLFNSIAALMLSLTAPVYSIIFFNSDIRPPWEYCEDDGWGVNLSLYGGYVTGKSQEIVYSSCDSSASASTVKSKLDWKVKNLWVVGATIDKTIFSILHLKVDGWTKVHASRSTMVDKDYLDQLDPKILTDISKSSNTKLEKAQWISGEFGYDFMNFSSACSEIKLRFSVGYQYNYWSWKSYGGKCNYDNGAWQGSFSDDELGISYEQRFSIPYLALQLDYQWNDWNILCFGKYTHIARASDHDFHALRNIVYKDTFKNGQFWAVGVEGSFNMWSCLERSLDLTLKYAYEQLNTTHGDTSIRVGQSSGGQSDSSYHIQDSAGINHQHQLIAIGLNAYF